MNMNNENEFFLEIQDKLSNIEKHISKLSISRQLKINKKNYLNYIFYSIIFIIFILILIFR